MNATRVLFALSLMGAVACGEAPESPAPNNTQAQQALETYRPLDPADPGPTGACMDLYPSCDQMCYPLTVDPGRPGYCCSGPMGVVRSTCTEQGLYTPGDKDGDGIIDQLDNCVFTPNPTQANNDRDQLGNPMPDWLGDACDNCPDHYNPEQYNADNDRHGDVCDSDIDGDGIPNSSDSCPLDADPTDLDTDNDGIGDACDSDDDNDGLPDLQDNCPKVVNPRQRNYDQDARGNLCDDDIDNDSILNQFDNCPTIPNRNQEDTTPGGLGDACEYRDVTLRRVMNAHGQLSHPEFAPWVMHLVPAHIQVDTMLATQSEPPKRRTRNIAFFSSGQQGFSIFSSTPQFCSLTGHRNDYKTNFHTTAPSRPYTVTNDSLMSRLVEDDTLDEYNTFMASAFDAQYEYSYFIWDKTRIVNAYYDWLTSKVEANNLETVFLAGHSRGGCLVAQLGKKFQQDYPNINLIVQLYDPVCAAEELSGVNVFVKHWNPLTTNNWHVFPTDLEAHFAPPANSDRSALRVLNILSGQDVAGAHAFTHSNDVDTLTENNTLWYQRFWSDETHGNVENLALRNFAQYNTSDDLGMGHLIESCQQLNCL